MTESANSIPEYRVQLEVFEGPLDLLLHLIEQQELEITKVSLAAVTDQYLRYLSQLEHLNAEVLADFLVVAAKLLLIKSRALLPSPPPIEGEGPEEDVGDDLVRQLLEYQKLKAAAALLRDREETGLRSYVRVANAPTLDRRLDLSDVTLESLLAAARDALSVQPPAPPVDEVVSPVAFTIGQKIQLISSRLKSRGVLRFRRLLLRATSRAEIIVTLLALLELLKERRVRAEQAELFGEILVYPVEQAPPEAQADQPPGNQSGTGVDANVVPVGVPHRDE